MMDRGWRSGAELLTMAALGDAKKVLSSLMALSKIKGLYRRDEVKQFTFNEHRLVLSRPLLIAGSSHTMHQISDIK